MRARRLTISVSLMFPIYNTISNEYSFLMRLSKESVIVIGFSNVFDLLYSF